MEMTTIKKDSAAWVENDPDVLPKSGYNTHVKNSIAQGKAQIDAGQGISADQVWEELGIE